MSQIARLLDAMVTMRAEALVLEDGAPVVARRPDGTSTPVSRQPLTGVQVRAVLGEVIDAARLDGLEEGAEASQSLTHGGTAFVLRVRRGTEGWRGEFRVDAVVRPPTPLSTAAHRATPAVAPAVAGGTERPAAAHAFIDALLREQMARGASDLHLRSGDRPLLRISGDMVRLEEHPVLEPAGLAAMLHAIMPGRNQREFGETNDTDFAYELPGVARFRINALQDRHGPALVSRAIPSRLVTAEELGLSAEVQALAHLTKGLVLVTGPTGSGKSTTLCGLVDLVNRQRRDHIVTIEDPIEFVHESKGCLVTQRQVGLHTGSFKHALRAALREDPDVVLVGELRDLETVGIAIETAETGHLVFGTLHTTTAASTIDRIIDQFPPDRQEQIRVMLSESLKGVIAQTLCKKIGGGRVAAMEILLSTPAVSNLIREGKTFQIPSIMQTSRRLGMVTLNDALADLVDRKLIEPQEAWLRSLDKPALVASLKGRGVDMGFAEPDAAASARPEPGGTPRPGAPTTRPGGLGRR